MKPPQYTTDLTISHLDSGLLDGGFLLVLGGADSLLPLGFSHFRLLVSLRHDVLTTNC